MARRVLHGSTTSRRIMCAPCYAAAPPGCRAAHSASRCGSREAGTPGCCWMACAERGLAGSAAAGQSREGLVCRADGWRLPPSGHLRAMPTIHEQGSFVHGPR